MAPRMGPATGPNTAPTPHIISAAGCRCGGKVASSTAWPIGMIGAPKKPWATRARISVSRLFARPHRNEATVKPSTVENIRLRQPSRLESHPVMGVATAVATRIQRDHPGNLVLCRGQGSAHLRQHQVGERDGHAKQHVGQLHHQQDEPLAAADAEEAALRRCGVQV